MHSLRGWTVAVALFGSAVAAPPGGLGPADLPALLARAGDRVASYDAQARTLICTETLLLQPLDSDWSPRGMPRRVVSELRVEWDPKARPTPKAQVVRRTISINGRPPDKAKRNPEDACMDPRPVSPEPLEFLLASHRADYAFTWAGTDRVDGRVAARIDYRPLNAPPASVVWKGDCVSVDVPAQERGRVWLDLESADVLRVDSRLEGRFDFNVPPDKQHFGPSWMEIERADETIRYKPIAFHNPDETVMLPVSIDALQIIRNSGAPRVRTHRDLSDYRRFLTSGKLVPPS